VVQLRLATEAAPVVRVIGPQLLGALGRLQVLRVYFDILVLRASAHCLCRFHLGEQLRPLAQIIEGVRLEADRAVRRPLAHPLGGCGGCRGCLGWRGAACKEKANYSKPKTSKGKTRMHAGWSKKEKKNINSR